MEADTRDGRSVVDISDGILAATVLEHSPESYQNILKLPMCEHHSAQCVAGYVSMSRRCGDTTRPLDLPRTKPNPLCRWMSIRLVLCLDSRLARTGKGNRRERARAKMARAKARARKVTRAKIRSRYPNLSNSKDTADIVTNGDTSALTCASSQFLHGLPSFVHRTTIHFPSAPSLSLISPFSHIPAMALLKNLQTPHPWTLCGILLPPTCFGESRCFSWYLPIEP